MTRRGAAAGWWLLAIAGQTALLMLTSAGRSVGYQHFQPLEGSGAAHLAARLVLLIQLLAVTFATLRHRAAVRRTIATMAPGWRFPVLAGVFVLTAATLSREPRDYALELVLASVASLAQLLTVCFAVAALPSGTLAAARQRLELLLGELSDMPQPGGVDRFALACALWTFAVAGLLTLFAYQRHPHIPDEVVYLLHARYFADGLLAMPLPPVPDAFNLDLMTYDPDRWFSPVPPGWPAILAIGAFFGVPWLVNPLLGAAAVLLAYLLLREMYPRRTARIVVLLLCASPWALFMAMNLMTHTATLACALAAAYAVARQRRGGSLLWAIPGGAMIGLVSLIRPLEGMALALLLGFWCLPARWRGRPLVPAALLTLATIAAGAVTFPYNKAMTGNARVHPIMDYVDRYYEPGANSLGFGANRGLGWSGLDPYPGHGARDVLVNTNLNVTQVNIELLGWSCGSLLAIWLLFSAGRARRQDWQMMTVIALIVGLHALYWFSGGPDFGARYWYLILVPCLVLAARGIESAEARLRGSMVAAAALVVLAMVVFVPWRAADKYYHYRGMRPDVRQLARQHDFGDALVIIRGDRHPDYHSAAVYNPVDLTARVPIYAWDRGPRVNERLLAAYPDRNIWIVDGPSRTGAGFVVRAGPLDATVARFQLIVP